MKREAKLPEAPRDVRVRHEDGTTTALEVRYAGLDDRGMHLWIATMPARLAPDAQQFGVHIGMFPPRTSIEVEVIL
jgi:hypothetical protein